MRAPYPLNRVRTKDRLGWCFPLCAKTLAKSECWVMVHGVVNSRDGQRIDHAWLVSLCGTAIYDAVLNRVFAFHDFMTTSVAVEVAEYTAQDMRQQIQHHHHYGPWHETLPQQQAM